MRPAHVTSRQAPIIVEQASYDALLLHKERLEQQLWERETKLLAWEGSIAELEAAKAKLEATLVAGAVKKGGVMDKEVWKIERKACLDKLEEEVRCRLGENMPGVLIKSCPSEAENERGAAWLEERLSFWYGRRHPGARLQR